jgi:hypothetical protein
MRYIAVISTEHEGSRKAGDGGRVERSQQCIHYNTDSGNSLENALERHRDYKRFGILPLRASRSRSKESIACAPLRMTQG